MNNKKNSFETRPHNVQIANIKQMYKVTAFVVTFCFEHGNYFWTFICIIIQAVVDNYNCYLLVIVSWKLLTLLHEIIFTGVMLNWTEPMKNAHHQMLVNYFNSESANTSFSESQKYFGRSIKQET